MNLIDAIKSGRPFRLPSSTTGLEHGWWTAHVNGGLVDDADNTDYPTLSELLADDWEIKPEPREWWLLANANDSALAFQSNAEAQEAANCLSEPRTIVHVREVVE